MDIEYAKEVLRIEADAISRLVDKIDDGFVSAAEIILECRGRVVTSGMGKAGIVAQKIAATLASTGTPALFMSPAEARHGDLGKVVANDVVLILSYSGKTDEVVNLIPVIKEIGARIIAITGDGNAELAKYSDVVVDMGRIEEACPLGLAPSASTTAMLALGDALALLILKERGFSREDYIKYHPSGVLGKMLYKVNELMRTGDANPTLPEDSTVTEVIAAITETRFPRAGCACIVDAAGKLVGLFTDGDLRRNLEQGTEFLNRPVRETIGGAPTTITPDRLATEAAKIMKEKKFDELPVVDKDGRVVGLVDIQDLLLIGIARDAD